MLVSIDKLDLDPHIITILRQNRFFVEPDKSHLPLNNQSVHWQIDSSKFQKINQFLAAPQPCAVFLGSENQPFMRVDQAFMKAMPGDEQAQLALDILHSEFDRCATPLVMAPGDLLIIDNALAAHGRSIYAPHYGPKQRWLRRVNVSTGWRHHVCFQESASSRALV